MSKVRILQIVAPLRPSRPLGTATTPAEAVPGLRPADAPRQPEIPRARGKPLKQLKQKTRARKSA